MCKSPERLLDLSHAAPSVRQNNGTQGDESLGVVLNWDRCAVCNARAASKRARPTEIDHGWLHAAVWSCYAARSTLTGKRRSHHIVQQAPIVILQ